MDDYKVETIKSWLAPTNSTKVRSFRGVGSFFNQRFTKDFSSLIALISKHTKKETFLWPRSTSDALEKLKTKLCDLSILALVDFEQVFRVKCDASRVGIKAVLL